MKVMQINCVYNTGSTGKIMYDIHTELEKRGIESVICYGRGAKTSDKNVYKTSGEKIAKFNNIKSRFTGMPYNGSFFATNKLLGIIKNEKPDIVHLHCINGYFVNIYRLVRFLKKNKIPTVVTHHGEFFYTGNCGHSYDCDKWKTGCGKCPSAKKAVNSYFFDFTRHNFKSMQKAFSGFERLYSVGVSPWVQSRAEQSPIFKDAVNTTVLNGLDAEIFAPKTDAEELRKKYGIAENQEVIIYVTASFESATKGGKYIIELAKRLGNKYRIIVVGNRETPADLPENIIAVGRVENQTELAKYYTMADLCVITGKRETFSMPVAEAMCCGTPVVGFLAGGPESITIKQYSSFVEYGNIEELEIAVKAMLKRKFVTKIFSERAKDVYSKENMCSEYIKIYEGLTRGKK